MHTDKKIPAPLFRVIVCVGAHTEKQAARIREQVAGMFAGAEVIVEPNEDKPALAGENLDLLTGRISELEAQLVQSDRDYEELQHGYADRGMEIDALKKELARRPAAADSPMNAGAKNPAPVKAPAVKVGDVLLDKYVAGATATVLEIDHEKGQVIVRTNDTERAPIDFQFFAECFEVAPPKLEIPANPAIPPVVKSESETPTPGAQPADSQASGQASGEAELVVPPSSGPGATATVAPTAAAPMAPSKPKKAPKADKAAKPKKPRKPATSKPASHK